MFALVVYFITAWNSHGYYHADEHYQIIEFAGIKLGTHNPSDLAWEYGAKIRSTIQPTLAYWVIASLKVFDVNNPYNQVFMLRLLSMLLAIITISYFISATHNQFKNETIKRVYYFLAYFLWFETVLSVRFSSEAWSGLFFLLGISFYLKNQKNTVTPFVVGLFFGLSFLFRFQIAFAIAGCVSWMLFINREKLTYAIKMGSIGIFILIAGFALDSWFVGETTFTIWNYFYKNIVEDVASGFGTSPWYFYMIKITTYPSFIIGAALLFSLGTLVIYDRKSLFLWSFIPFLILHSIIPHKEMRFLFPLVYFVPVFLCTALNFLSKTIKTNHPVFKLFVLLFFICNTVGLAAMSVKSAGLGRMEITKYIHENYGDKKINLIFCSWANPYNPWHGLEAKYYIEKNITQIKIDDICSLSNAEIVPDAVNLLVLRRAELIHETCYSNMLEKGFVFETMSFPAWVEFLSRIYKEKTSTEVLELYKYKG